MSNPSPTVDRVAPPPADKPVPGPTGGEILLERLQAHGVDYLFANGGTDFAPIIEGLARGQARGTPMPRALVMPHETAAVGMAHGYFLVTGKPQAVMVHTNVGLANVVMGAINAATEQVPMLLCSGRTPVTETGYLGSRSTPINWGQEMRDQTALVREAVKWDFELRYPEQVADLVDRAMAITRSTPPGPVHLSLPREALCASVDPAIVPAPRPQAPAVAAPDADALDRAAVILRDAQRPLIIAHRSGDTEAGFTALRRFAEGHAIPVVEFWPSRNCLSTDSPMHAGYDPAEDLARADAVLVLDTLVPWLPHRHPIPADCKVIQAGPDPLHQRFPVRGFRADVSLNGTALTVLDGLDRRLQQAAAGRADYADHVARRTRELGARHAARRDARLDHAREGATAPMTAAWVSHCVADALGDDGIVFTEMGVEAAFMNLPRAARYFSHPVSGGLGWGLTAALGAQLADRERLVVAAVGDGAYTFANPVACHQIAEALELPLLTVVFNNGAWNTVRLSTLDIFPDGEAAACDTMPVSSLQPSPDYCQIAAASRAWTERVERGEDLPGALQRAREVIARERRQALIEVVVRPK